MLFFKGYLNKNETKAIEAVDKLRDQDKLLQAVREIQSGPVLIVAVRKLDSSHLFKLDRERRRRHHGPGYSGGIRPEVRPGRPGRPGPRGGAEEDG